MGLPGYKEELTFPRRTLRPTLRREVAVNHPGHAEGRSASYQAQEWSSMKIERTASSGLKINVLKGNEGDLQTNTTQSIFRPPFAAICGRKSPR